MIAFPIFSLKSRPSLGYASCEAIPLKPSLPAICNTALQILFQWLIMISSSDINIMSLNPLTTYLHHRIDIEAHCYC